MANLALASIDLIHFALPIMQRLCNTLLTKRRSLSGTSSKQWRPSRGSPSKVLPTPPSSTTCLDVLPLAVSCQRHPRHDPDQGQEGYLLLLSLQDVFDVVFCHKPLFCSNRLKFIGVFFEVFTKTLVQLLVDFKTLDLTNLLDRSALSGDRPSAPVSLTSSQCPAPLSSLFPPS